MKKIQIVAITDIEHSSPRIPNLLYYLDKDKYELFLVGANFAEYLTKEDLPPDFFERIKTSFFRRKINIFSSLKRNIENSNIISDKRKKSTIYLYFRKMLINFLLYINFPDQYIFTVNKYLKNFNSLRLKGDILLLSSSPYPTSHIAAYKIKSNSKLGIKWIADYRDLWSLNSNYSFNSLRLFFEKKYEKKILQFADRVVTVSDPWAIKQGELLSRKIDVIPNGYTIQSESYNLKTNSNLPLLKKQKIYILYVGAIYFSSQDVSMFFNSLKNIDMDNIEIHFIGRHSYELDLLIKQNKLENNVKQIGKLSRAESQKLQKLYDYLLFFDLKDDDGWVLLKFYEYIGANKPIICIGGAIKTAHKKIMHKLSRGKILLNEEQIIDFFKSVQKISHEKINLEDSFAYSYKTQSKKMENLIDSIYNN